MKGNAMRVRSAVARLGALVAATVVLSGASGLHTFEVDAGKKAEFGLRYPGSYRFWSPRAVGVEKDGAALWDTTGADLGTSGIEGARFVGTGEVVVSAFVPASRTAFSLRFVGSSGETVEAEYLGMPRYYDNRPSAVVVTGDDWCEIAEEGFLEACDTLQARGLWFTPGITVGGLACWAGGIGAPTWSAIQAEIDEGFVEPAAHAFWHVHVPYDSAHCDVTPSYHEEIIASRDSILANLTMPEQSAGKLLAWIEPFGESDDSVRTYLDEGAYLVARRTGTIYYQYAEWSEAEDLFERVGITTLGFEGTPDTTLMKSRFDISRANRGIWHGWGHPRSVDWGYMSGVLDYISGHPDVWYVGFGHLYAYRLLSVPGVVTHSESTDRPYVRPVMGEK
jgi:hypothetical protein